MAEAAKTYDGMPHALEERRLLTEVTHLRAYFEPDGNVAPAVLNDVKTNLFTAIQEMAIPSAVTTTVQRVAHERDEQGRSRRTITWLGRSAVEVAESGRQFHFSEPARKRVDCEIAEARDSQQTLRPGVVQVFISPKMSRADAPADVARAEHLYADDAVRVSRAVIDSKDQIVARQMESLLVTGIPLRAWTDMLQDSNNIFGRSISLGDTTSALSVMEAYGQLELPLEVVPEGPITILQSVTTYISNQTQKTQVLEQIARFQQGQEAYRTQAEQAANDWLMFDLELAKSLEQGTASLEIERYIAVLQHDWTADEHRVIVGHDAAGEYIMTEQLAALLEKKQRHLLASRVALATNNQALFSQANAETITQLQSQITELAALRGQPDDLAEYMHRQTLLMRNLSRQNFKVGGGCAGSAGGSESDGSSTNEYQTDSDGNQSEKARESSGVWQWKKGVCRVKRCPSPQPTEVGPCSVCRNCQRKFDQGQDPTTNSDAYVPKTSLGAKESGRLKLDEFIKKLFQTEVSDQESHKKPLKPASETIFSL